MLQKDEDIELMDYIAKLAKAHGRAERDAELAYDEVRRLKTTVEKLQRRLEGGQDEPDPR